MKICSESVQHAIDTELAHVTLSAEQKQAILAQCRPSVTVRRPKTVLFKRAIAVAAAVAVFTVGGVGVLAQNPGLAQKLELLGDHTLSMLQPINLVSMDDGIRMEVLAALNDRETAAIYLTLQDTTGQGRITEDMDLRHIQVSGATFSSAQVIDFDEVSNTATICLTGEDGQLANRKISVTLRTFLTGWTYETDAGPADCDISYLDLLGLPAPTLDSDPQIHGYSAVGEESLIPDADQGDLDVLVPAKEGIPLPGAPWAQITAAGIVDGKLHIQLLHDNQLGLYNDVTFYLTDRDGNELTLPNAVAERGRQEKIAPHWTVSRLQEHIFELPPEIDPADLRLHYDLGAYSTLHKGTWSVAFTLEDAAEAITIPCPMEFPGWDMDTVEIGTLGITLYGHENGGPVIEAPQIKLTLKDGTTVSFWSSSTSCSGEQIVERDLYRLPLDLSQIAQLTINDVPVELPLTVPAE